jgi:hypothetical protein
MSCSRTAAARRTPVWLVPHFEQHQVVTCPPPDPPQFTARQAQSVMVRCGLRPVLSVAALSAALELLSRERQSVLEQAITFFRARACRVPRGLETLPTPWLTGLPGILWSLRKPHWTHLPYMIDRVGWSEGLLLLSFAQEARRKTSRLNSWDRLRVQVNQRLYPNRFRDLKRRHRRQLWQRHPELRAELQANPLEL